MPDPQPEPAKKKRPPATARKDRLAFYEALQRAQLAAQPIQATREPHASAGKWKYASEADIIEPLKKHLLTEGLVLTASAELLQETTSETKDGKLQWRSELRITFTVTHKSSGYSEDYHWPGVALDTQDRGPRHAVAAAYKPFLLALLFTYTTEDRPPAPEQSTRATRKTERSPQEHLQEEKRRADPATGLEAARPDFLGELERVRRENEPWDLEALKAADPELDDEIEPESFPTAELDRFLNYFRGAKRVNVIHRALEAVAKREPLTDGLLEGLEKWIETDSPLGIADRARVQVVIDSGWNRAAIILLEELQRRE